MGRGKTTEGAHAGLYRRMRVSKTCAADAGAVSGKSTFREPRKKAKKLPGCGRLPSVSASREWGAASMPQASGGCQFLVRPTSPSIASRARKCRSFTSGTGAPEAVPYIERTGLFRGVGRIAGQGAYEAVPFGVILSTACGRTCDSFAASSLGGIPSFAASCCTVSEPRA